MTSSVQTTTMRVPYFTGLDAIEENQSYATHINAANELAKTYKPEYQTTATEMEDLAAAWNKDQLEATKTLLQDRVSTLITYQQKRAEAVQTMEKIRTAYQAAIKYCAEPSLDPATLIILKKMRVEMATIEQRFIEIFVKSPAALRTESERALGLIKRLNEGFESMKRALEPTAYRLEGSWMGSVFSAGPTPTVDHLVRVRSRELELQQPAENVEAAPQVTAAQTT